MIILEIPDKKQFLKLFLTGRSFDAFTLAEAQVTTFCTYTIDGRLERGFYRDGSPGEADGAGQAAGTGTMAGAGQAPGTGQEIEYVPWRDVRSRCLEMVKGKHFPLSFRFVLFYPKDRLGAFLEKHGIHPDGDGVTGLCINLRFSGDRLQLTTGVARRSFSMDRSVDDLWDKAVRGFFAKLEIPTEEVQ